MKLILLSLLAGILCSCSSSDGKQLDPPKSSYDYYSGEGEYGNHYCKIQSFSNTSGKIVTLIAMIHTADASFYNQVDKELDKADVILTEGIYGIPSFGPHKYFSKYTFSIIERFMFLQGLMPQGETMKERENEVIADVSAETFASQGSFYTPLLQLISLPVMIVFTEPYYLYEKSKKSLTSVFSDDMRRKSDANLRHLTLKNLDSTDAPARALLPGIINGRNKVLFDKLIKELQKDDVKIIAVPWGASHMPSFEKDLLNFGFKKHGVAQWLRSIAVKDFLESDEKFEEPSMSWGIPYLYTVKTSRKSYDIAILFSLIHNKESGDYNRSSLVYGDLFDSISYDKGSYTSLLPRIAGRPILFDYTVRNDKSRFRLFWFIEFGSLD